jgi:hypothetical protein
MRTALCGLAGAIAVAQPLPEQQWPLSTKGRTLSWPGTAVIDSYQQQQKCIWSTYKQCNKTGYCGQQIQDGLPICLRSDSVSNSIRTTGQWLECNQVLDLWRHQPAGAGSTGIFGAIGANIGPCVLHMLLHSNARVIAVEPARENLYCLTQTLLRLDKRHRERVVVLPVGSSNIDLSHGRLEFRRMDSLLRQGSELQVVSVDVQGAECRTVEGLGVLLGSIAAMKIQVAPITLGKGGCSTLR